jgi:hypothetical protein
MKMITWAADHHPSSRGFLPRLGRRTIHSAAVISLPRFKGQGFGAVMSPAQAPDYAGALDQYFATTGPPKR